MSHWKPVKSWSQVYAAGNAFVGIKATEGERVVDPLLRQHRDGSRAQPFILSTYYHFARSGDPEKQAERLLDSVGQLRDYERLALDLEVSVTERPRDTLEWMNEFFEVVMGAYGDRRPQLYTSERIWRSIGDPADWAFADHVDLWLPRYGPAEPVVPAPWRDAGWMFWQYSDHATCPGVEGACDASVFHADVAALRAYAKLTPTPPPTLG